MIDKDFFEFSGTEVERVDVHSKIELPRTIMYRAPFGSNTRWYFKQGDTEFYSGVTGAMKASGLIDYTHLYSARERLAAQGVSADELWGERAEYGSCFHYLVALHEREELVFSFDDKQWEFVVEAWCEKYNFPQLLRSWKDDIRNDMMAYFNWKKDRGVKVLATEIMTCHNEWRIATPLDIICTMDFGGKEILANVNLKTGAKPFPTSNYFQAAMEAHMFNLSSPDVKLEGSFLWRPKDRKRSPHSWDMSKNCLGFSLYGKGEQEYQTVGDMVLLKETYKPSGTICVYKGGEGDAEVTTLNPYQWLDRFNEQFQEDKMPF